MNTFITVFFAGLLGFILGMEAAFANELPYKAEITGYPKGGQSSLSAETPEKLDKKIERFLRHKQLRDRVQWKPCKGQCPDRCLAVVQTREIDGTYSVNECALSDVISIEKVDNSVQIALKKKEEKERRLLREDLMEAVKERDLTPAEISKLLRGEGRPESFFEKLGF